MTFKKLQAKFEQLYNLQESLKDDIRVEGKETLPLKREIEDFKFQFDKLYDLLKTGEVKLRSSLTKNPESTFVVNREKITSNLNGQTIYRNEVLYFGK